MNFLGRMRYRRTSIRYRYRYRPESQSLGKTSLMHSFLFTYKHLFPPTSQKLISNFHTVLLWIHSHNYKIPKKNSNAYFSNCPLTQVLSLLPTLGGSPLIETKGCNNLSKSRNQTNANSISLTRIHISLQLSQTFPQLRHSIEWKCATNHQML